MKIELSKAEIKCLFQMASQVAEHGDVLQQEFPNGKQRATAERAYAKLEAALGAVKRRSPSTKGPTK